MPISRSPVPKFLALACFAFLPVLLPTSLAMEVTAGPSVNAPFFGIRLVDAETGKGIPLASLRQVNEAMFWTDNQGWIAWAEPGLFGRETWFSAVSPGYEIPKDGFGNAGFRVIPKAGESVVIKLRRTQHAERFGRLTGTDLDRDSKILGVPQGTISHTPPECVAGQDTVFTAVWKNERIWLWGDTSTPKYPLGVFQTVCAKTSPDETPATGLDYRYFYDPEKQLPKAMMPLPEPGVVWLGGLSVLPDTTGAERMTAHFSRRENLEIELEQGLAEFDAETETFIRLKAIENPADWRRPEGHPVIREGYIYFGNPFFTVRAPATFEGVTDPDAYECLAWDKAASAYTWTREVTPVTQESEKQKVNAGEQTSANARFQLKTADGAEIIIHRGSIRWNPWLKRWLLIGNRYGGEGSPSFLGEVYAAAAAEMNGPWNLAVPIATHPDYTFYNPVHHDFWDEEGGKIIYFEGTYTAEFSGNEDKTPRYNYNQILYRLDLSRLRLTAE